MKRKAFNTAHYLKQSIFCRKLFRFALFRPLLIWPAFLLAALLFSCDPEESCVSLVANRLGTGFFVINEEGVREPATFFYRQIRAVERDTAFYTMQNTGVRSLNLALNPGADSTTFVFDQVQGGGIDTLQLAYERNFRMIAPDCGLELRYANIRLVRHTFDSVNLITTDINDEPREPQNLDIEIFSQRICEVPQTNRFSLGFFRMEENGQAVPQLVNFDSVRAVASDSVFYSRNESGISSLELALDPGANRTVFRFEQESDIDTLIVSYNRQFDITTPYCDPEIFYSELEVEYSSFGHVGVLNSSLTEGREGYDLAVFAESLCSIPAPIPYRLGFFRINEGGEAEPLLMNFDEVTAIGREQAFYEGDNEEGISDLDLLLDPEANSTTFLFSAGEATDTLTVIYTRTPVPSGPEPYCEPYNRYSKLEISYSTFERAEQLTQELTENSEDFDVEIYP